MKYLPDPKQLLFLLLSTGYYVTGIIVKNNYCQYAGNTANCSGFGNSLTFIPPIRHGTRNLIFNYNYLPFVSKATFGNVSASQIYSLNLCNDEIETITSSAFHGFTRLVEIALSGNKITGSQLQDVLGKLSNIHSLRTLLLDSLALKSFPSDLFTGMENSSVTNITLERNNLGTISKPLFTPLKNIEFIDIRRNGLHHIDIPILTHLQTLFLEKNKLRRIPNFCVNNSVEISAVPALRDLHLRQNLISEVSNIYLKCLPKLILLDLGQNYINLFPNYMLSNLPNLAVLRIPFLEVRFPVVQPYAFQSVSLRGLNIANTISAQTMFVSLNETFKHSPNLVYLRSDNIGFDEWTDDMMAELFSNLVKLETISLRKCRLDFTPKRLLKNMPNLRSVNLALNFIKELTPLTFSANKHIRSLYLEANKITHVNQSVFTPIFLHNLRKLSMKFNPYSCTCDLQWFMEWLQKTYKNNKKMSLKGYPNDYKCASPSALAGSRLSDVSFTYRQCHPWGPGFWIGVVGGAFVLVVTIISAIIYRNRWNIKHYIYLLRRRNQYNKLDGHDYLYDAFVAYNDNDYQWVIKELLPELEDGEGYKLCIHERDFQPGMYINDNISDRMEESRSILLVLSDSFVTSNWCRFEMKVAHARHIEDNVNLIVVILELPKAKRMSKELKSLLQNTTYIEWTEDPVGRNLFWNKLKDSIMR